MLILKCWNIQISNRLSPYETGIRCPSYKMSFKKKTKTKKKGRCPLNTPNSSVVTLKFYL